VADFCYTTVPGKIKPLLAKVREVGVPKRAGVQWLKTLGFTSSNDASLLKVLTQIDLIDAGSSPTARWNRYRGADYRSVLAEAIVQGYSELYSVYPDAHRRSNEELDHVFSTHSEGGSSVSPRQSAPSKHSSSWLTSQLRPRPQPARRRRDLACRSPPRRRTPPLAGVCRFSRRPHRPADPHIAGGICRPDRQGLREYCSPPVQGREAPRVMPAQDVLVAAQAIQKDISDLLDPPPKACQRQVRAWCPSPSLGARAGTSKAWPTRPMGLRERLV